MEKYKKSADYQAFKNSNKVPDLVKSICKKFKIDCKKRNPTTFPVDPNAPKRAASAYFLFGASVREGIQKKLKGQPVSEVAKAIAQQWKKISDSDKASLKRKRQLQRKQVKLRKR